MSGGTLIELSPAELLWKLRRADGMTQKEAADLLGFTAGASVISRYERGAVDMSPQTRMLVRLWHQCGAEALAALRGAA